MIMKTLTEHLDDLDKMVDGRADIDKIRSQIAFIAREAAALEADYTRLAQDHAQVNEAHAKLEKEHSDLKDTQARKAAQDWNQRARASHIQATYESPE
jgi:predicted nuclease with TOPRIM domain